MFSRFLRIHVVAIRKLSLEPEGSDARHVSLLFSGGILSARTFNRPKLIETGYSLSLLVCASLINSLSSASMCCWNFCAHTSRSLFLFIKHQNSLNIHSTHSLLLICCAAWRFLCLFMPRFGLKISNKTKIIMKGLEIGFSDLRAIFQFHCDFSLHLKLDQRDDAVIGLGHKLNLKAQFKLIFG
jgi:hypothetical protein